MITPITQPSIIQIVRYKWGIWEKRIKYRDLVANVVMLQNVVDMTNVLHDLQRDGVRITPELLGCMSPYLTGHLKRFGHYILDMETPPEPLRPKPLFVTVP